MISNDAGKKFIDPKTAGRLLTRRLVREFPLAWGRRACEFAERRAPGRTPGEET
jgi:hypothetical protein